MSVELLSEHSSVTSIVHGLVKTTFHQEKSCGDAVPQMVRSNLSGKPNQIFMAEDLIYPPERASFMWSIDAADVEADMEPLAGFFPFTSMIREFFPSRRSKFCVKPSLASCTVAMNPFSVSG